MRGLPALPGGDEAADVGGEEADGVVSGESGKRQALSGKRTERWTRGKGSVLLTTHCRSERPPSRRRLEVGGTEGR